MINQSISRFLVSALVVFGATLVNAQSPNLKVGDLAPPLKVSAWTKGVPIKSFVPGNVYVVEFWATWCAPCKVSIPHLTEMAGKYAGKVLFAGIDVQEGASQGTPAGIQKIRSFVKGMGPKMDYNVAVDRPDNFMGSQWLKASNQPGIPTAFIVDAKGRIAWIGHPMNGLDETLEKHLTGKWNAKAEAKSVADANKEKADQARSAEQVKQFDALLHADEPAARKLFDSLLADPDEANIFTLWNMSGLIMRGPKTYAPETYLGIVKVMKVFVEKYPNFNVSGAYSNMSDAYEKAGDRDNAIAACQKALELAEKKGEDARRLGALKKRLADRKGLKL